MNLNTIAKEAEQWPAEVGHELRKAGRQVWLAGLGAIQTLDEQGRDLFAGLIERGKRLEVPDVEERLRAGGEKIRDLGRRAERRIEERMSSALQRFGVPSRDDVKLLGDRIEELTRKVESLKN